MRTILDALRYIAVVVLCLGLFLVSQLVIWRVLQGIGEARMVDWFDDGPWGMLFLCFLLLILSVWLPPRIAPSRFVGAILMTSCYLVVFGITVYGTFASGAWPTSSLVYVIVVTVLTFIGCAAAIFGYRDEDRVRAAKREQLLLVEDEELHHLRQRSGE